MRYLKHSLVFLFLLPIVLLAQRPCDRQHVEIQGSLKCPSYTFEPTFRDDFEGKSLDTSKWEAIEGVVRDPYHSVENQWYTPDNIELRDGCLYLVAKRQQPTRQTYAIWMGDGMQKFAEPFEYTSAEIDTKAKFGYGKYEIRCKLPKGQGFFPAFWTFGGPGWNEIDVFEFWNEKGLTGNKPDRLLSRKHKMNVHFDYDGDGKSNNCPAKYKGPDFSEDFHVFTLIWTPYRLEWYVDGEFKRAANLYQKGRRSRLDCKDLKLGKKYKRNKIFPIQKMHIIANLAIQSGENAPDDTTPFPSALVIDYISYEAMVDKTSKRIIPVKGQQQKP